MISRCHPLWLECDVGYTLVKVLLQLKGHEAVLQVPDGDVLQDVPLFVPVAQRHQQLAGCVPGLHQGDSGRKESISNKLASKQANKQSYSLTVVEKKILDASCIESHS